MSAQPPQSESFDVDLTNCDREPIHQLGHVQPFGFLLGVSRDWIVKHASRNVRDSIGEEAEALIGRPARGLLSRDALHEVRSRLQLLYDSDSVERIFRLPAFEGDGTLYDIAVHVSGRTIVMEFEPSGERSQDYFAYVRPMVDRVSRADTVDAACKLAARQMKALTGFDRVMVYKFRPDETGEVIAEAMHGDMESWLGLRYPASDIPRQARALYTRNLLRIIADVDGEPSPIVPAVDADGAPLDLSLSTLRSVSPIHLEYLRNMQVGASMSVSIVKDGKLWGLLACHNAKPKVLSFEVRTAAEFFGQLFAYVLDQRENEAARAEAARAEELHDQLMAPIAEGQSIAANFDILRETIPGAISCSGLASYVDGRYRSDGKAPTEEEFQLLLPFLNTTAASEVYATDNLWAVFPQARNIGHSPAGILVLPVSRAPRDFIVLFREELTREVRWAGNPDKAVTAGEGGTRLHPRKSFAEWQEIVEGHSEPWAPRELRVAERLRATLHELVLRMSDSAAQERAGAQERQEVLIAELNHRVRNVLNLIRGIISSTGPGVSSVEELTDIVGGRILALARAHDQISGVSWSPVSFRQLLATELEAYRGPGGERVEIEGPDVLIKPDAVSTLALVFHELTTNSVKHGALGVPEGRLRIEITDQGDGALTVAWREKGGPPVTPPSRRGFGSIIIERSIPFELHGTTEVRYAPSGLEADMVIPRPHIACFADAAAAETATHEAEDEETPVLDGDVLITEDNVIIALSAEDAVLQLGARSAYVCSTVAEAQDVLAERDVAFAMLDVKLGNETSAPLAATLAERGIPFAFTTGYGDHNPVTSAHPDAPLIHKPYDARSVRRAVQSLKR